MVNHIARRMVRPGQVGLISAFTVVGLMATAGSASADVTNIDIRTSAAFRMDGPTESFSGFSVAGGGDVNSDGYDDVVVGAPYVLGGLDWEEPTGAGYLVFGTSPAKNLGLGTLGASGTAIAGEPGDYVGETVADAGDVNHDGYDDIIVANSGVVRGGGIDGGMSRVVFGGARPDYWNGFTIYGAWYENSGYSVDGAGDVNNDGYDDIIIGAPEIEMAPDRPGCAYVVYGSARPRDVNLSALGSAGFRIGRSGPEEYRWEMNGYSVSGAGDVNRDGFDDVIVSGKDTYVVYGSAHPGNVNMANMGTAGFKVPGTSGSSVSDAGDVNDDGYDDVVVSTHASAYVIFGSANPSDVNGNTLGTAGVRIDGLAADAHTGSLVSAAGDVNRDGFDDVIIGSRSIDWDFTHQASAYIVYGSANPVNVDLTTLNSAGFKITGAVIADESRTWAAGAGDVNDDGSADLIIGSNAESNFGRYNSGRTYVLYGPVVNGQLVPNPPTGVSAVASGTQATVSWTAPKANGRGVTGYLVDSSAGGRTCSATASKSSCVVSGLTAGQTYRFTVRTKGTKGNSPASQASAPVVVQGPPKAVTGLSATPGDGKATVTFSPPADDGGSPVTGYEHSVNGGPWTPISSTATVSGLTNGKVATIRVRAVNAIGPGAPLSVTVTPFGAPAAPGNVKATKRTATSITVTYSAAAANGKPVDLYTVTASPGGKTCQAKTTTCIVTGLTAGTYTFSVTARNAAGTGPAGGPSNSVTLG